jgi:hypothetical protein
MVVGLTTTFAIRINNYLCNQCLSPLKLRVGTPFRRGVHDTTLCDKVCQGLATSRWFSPVTPISSTNKTDHHDITKCLKVVSYNTINQTISNLILRLYVFFIFLMSYFNEKTNVHFMQSSTKITNIFTILGKI